MFGNMMGKLQDAQKKMDEVKSRLDAIYVDGEDGSGLVKVTMNGNKKVKEISISEDLVKDGDNEAIEDLMVVAVNRALEKAESVYESEMRHVAMGMM